MRTRYLIVILIAGVIIMVTSAIHFFVGPKRGDLAPLFTLKDISGNQISLQSYRGKVVFLHFWATWCGRCLAEVPQIEKLYQGFKNERAAVLSILVDDEAGSVEKIKGMTPVSYPVLEDPEGEVADSYAVWGVPESFIIGRDGIILNRFTRIAGYDELKGRFEHYLAQ